MHVHVSRFVKGLTPWGIFHNFGANEVHWYFHVHTPWAVFRACESVEFSMSFHGKRTRFSFPRMTE